MTATVIPVDGPRPTLEAMQALVEIELAQLATDERIQVLTDAWDRMVKPALLREAETQAALRKVKAFPVPFPIDVG